MLWYFLLKAVFASLFVRHARLEDCNQNVTSLQGTFHSPNFPSDYMNNLNCIFHITVPAGSKIVLRFHFFFLEHASENGTCPDYVEVHDGTSLTSPLLNKRFCGRGTGDSGGPTTLIRSTGNHLTVHFFTNYRNSFPGFNASFHTDSKGDYFALVLDQTHGNLYRLDLLTLSYFPLPIPDPHEPMDIGYDPYKRPLEVFWIDRDDTRIFSGSIDGSTILVEDLVELGENAEIDDIVVDASSNIIFFADSGNDVIGLASTDSHSYRHIVASAFLAKTQVTFDPTSRHVFWSNSSSIQRCSYNGTLRKTVVKVSISTHILSVTLDRNEHTLIWLTRSAAGRVVIQSSDLDGKKKTSIFDTDVDTYNFVSMVFYQANLYIIRWNDSSHGKSSQVNWLSEDGPREIWTTDKFTISNVAIYRQDAKLREPTECLKENGGCSHICIPLLGNETQCMCPDGMSLGVEKRLCSSPDESDEGIAVRLTVGIIFAFVVAAAALVILCVLYKKWRPADRYERHNDDVNGDSGVFVSDARTEERNTPDGSERQNDSTAIRLEILDNSYLGIDNASMESSVPQSLRSGSSEENGSHHETTPKESVMSTGTHQDS